jgi:hypothetical protein
MYDDDFSRRPGRRWENNFKMSNEKLGVILSIGFIWLLTRSSDSLCEHGSGSSGHVQIREFHASYAEEYCEDVEEGNAELN